MQTNQFVGYKLVWYIYPCIWTLFLYTCIDVFMVLSMYINFVSVQMWVVVMYVCIGSGYCNPSKQQPMEMYISHMS